MLLTEGQVVRLWEDTDGGEARLFRRTFRDTPVFIADTAMAVRAVTSRHQFGGDKQRLFREATADMLLHAWPVVGRDWPDGPVVETVIMRGADHVRPHDPGALMGRSTIRTAIRLQRFEASPGNWTARWDEGSGLNENLNALFAAPAVVVWDGCSASGSTQKGLLWLLKQRNPHLSRVLVICPFMGGLALRRVAEQGEEIGVHIEVLAFGVYRVAPIGWGGKTETDIYIPPDPVLVGSQSMAVPLRQREAYRRFYQPRTLNTDGSAGGDDGMCLVGDVGESMGSPQEQRAYVRSTIESWPIFCEAAIPDSLIHAQRELESAQTT